MTNYQLLRALELIATAGHADYRPFVVDDKLQVAPADMRLPVDAMLNLLALGVKPLTGTYGYHLDLADLKL